MHWLLLLEANQIAISCIFATKTLANPMTFLYSFLLMNFNNDLKSTDPIGYVKTYQASEVIVFGYSWTRWIVLINVFSIFFNSFHYSVIDSNDNLNILTFIFSSMSSLPFLLVFGLSLTLFLILKIIPRLTRTIPTWISLFTPS